jgi:hypothetical protein
VAAYVALDDAELLRRLRSWSPVVRERAAMALVRGKEAIVPTLIAMLEEPQGAGSAAEALAARYGACQALAHLGGAAAAAVPALQTCLGHPDLWLRVQAAKALGQVGKAALPAVPKLLAALARAPAESDPRGMEQRYLCVVLFDRREGLLRRQLDGVDRQQLYAAIRVGLRNQDGHARSIVANAYDWMSFETIEPLLPAIYEAVQQPAPSGEMFADGVRLAGLKLLAKHHVEEGIQACVHYVRHMNPWESQLRVPQVLQILREYGAHAQPFVPELLLIAEYFERDEPDFPKQLSRQKAKAVRDAVAEIRAAVDRPALVRIL